MPHEHSTGNEKSARSLLIDQTCPSCGSGMFIIGPRAGGMAGNIKCAACGDKFWFNPKGSQAMQIHNSDEVYQTEPIHLAIWLAQMKAMRNLL
jgi:hypothetical protein